MPERDELAARFETHRGRLRAIAYRLLGSTAEVDDAVQETWLRMARSRMDEVDNVGAWLTTTLSRICLDVLRTRRSRREVSWDAHVPDPLVEAAPDPAQQVELTDSVSIALLVVLDTLTPAERLAFVLHDVFAVPFAEVATLMERSPAAAKQLASRARRRVRDVPAPQPDLRRQREIVDAFIAATRDGDFQALIAVLDPDVVLRADAGDGPLGPSRVLRGAQAVAMQAMHFAPMSQFAVPAMINGAIGAVAMPGGRAAAVLSVTISDGRIAEMNILADPVRLAGMDFSALVTPDDAD